MSKIIASAAIRGAHKIVYQAEQKWQQAMDEWGANEPVGFPNTAYYLPVIYGILGAKVEKLADMEPVLHKCKSLLPPPVREQVPSGAVGPALVTCQSNPPPHGANHWVQPVSSPVDQSPFTTAAALAVAAHASNASEHRTTFFRMITTPPRHNDYRPGGA